MANKMELTEFEFPDEAEEKAKTQAEEKKAAVSEEEFDLEVVDDTPPQDRGRKPMSDPPEDVTDDELKSYDEKVQARIKKFTRGYHDERRAKEALAREKQELERLAQHMIEENKRLKELLNIATKGVPIGSGGAGHVTVTQYGGANPGGNPDSSACIGKFAPGHGVGGASGSDVIAEDKKPLTTLKPNMFADNSDAAKVFPPRDDDKEADQYIVHTRQPGGEWVNLNPDPSSRSEMTRAYAAEEARDKGKRFEL